MANATEAVQVHANSAHFDLAKVRNKNEFRNMCWSCRNVDRIMFYLNLA